MFDNMSQPWEYSCLGVVYSFPTIIPRNFSNWSMFLICKVQIYRNLLMDCSSNSLALIDALCMFLATNERNYSLWFQPKNCSLVEHQDDLMVQVIWFYANVWTCGQFDQDSIQSIRLVKVVHLFFMLSFTLWNLTTSSCWHKKFGL